MINYSLNIPGPGARLFRSPDPVFRFRPIINPESVRVRSGVVQAARFLPLSLFFNNSNQLKKQGPGGPGGPGNICPIVCARACFSLFLLYFGFLKKNLDHRDQTNKNAAFRLDQTPDHTRTDPDQTKKQQRIEK